MRLGRFVSDIRALHGALAGLLAEEVDEQATLDLAVSAQEFSNRTRAVVDDKLTFTATLMRAGEVAAATRLFNEVERDVRDEEAALLERVNEVRAAQATRRAGVTRLRLARVVVVAMLGSALMASSAVGMTLAGLLRDRADQQVALADDSRRAKAHRVASVEQRRHRQKLREVQVAPGVKVELTASELQRYRTLMTSGAPTTELEQFLYDVLGPALAERVRTVLATATTSVDQAAAAPKALALQVKKQKKKMRQAARAEASEQQAQQEKQEPQPSPQSSPSPNENRQDDRGRSGSDEEGPGERVPLPNGDEAGKKLGL